MRSNKINNKGFTLIELLVSMIMVVLLFISFGTFFINYTTLYYGLQTDASNSVQMTQEIERIASVLRGVTEITSASSDSLSCYGYFSPDDTYVSLINYYVSNNEVFASVTPMTADPPGGTPITSETKTYTVITNYYDPLGSGLFSYYDSSGNLLSLPISNERSISSVGINLSTPASHNKQGQQMSTTVTLRNMRIST